MRERELDRTIGLGNRISNGIAEKPAAETLNGDPQNLIRVMPANGDRSADLLAAGLRQAVRAGGIRTAALIPARDQKPALGPRATGGLSPLTAGPAALPAALSRRDPEPMKGWFAHRDPAHGDTADLGKLDDLLPGLRHVMADRACCCPARPVVTVVMPPAPGRPHPVDLLLCGHHFRVSRAALTAAGAAVYDDTGALVAGGVSEYGHDPREHAAAA